MGSRKNVPGLIFPNAAPNLSYRAPAMRFRFGLSSKKNELARFTKWIFKGALQELMFFSTVPPGSC
jgi:hypothetical protein